MDESHTIDLKYYFINYLFSIKVNIFGSLSLKGLLRTSLSRFIINCIIDSINLVHNQFDEFISKIQYQYIIRMKRLFN